MDKKSEEKFSKVKEMSDPVAMMNPHDLDIFKGQAGEDLVEQDGHYCYCERFVIVASDLVQKGKLHFYDNAKTTIKIL